MEESKAMAQHQQQQQQQHHQQQQQQQQFLMQQHHQQQAQQAHHQQQQYLLLQQLQRQQQQQQQAAISRFPSNIDAHLRPPSILHHRPPINLQQNPNPNPNLPQQGNPNFQQLNPQQQQQMQQQQMQLQIQQKGMRPLNQLELQFAYQDALRVCKPDFKRPFSSVEDACERLLPYHVVADYEAEEDDRILDSDTTGQMLSRSQQWDHNIAAKVAEFTATFEKQALAFNIITRKRAGGDFRSEERLMIEQALLQEERKATVELKAEIDSREKAGREAHEAKLRMAAMYQAEQARNESQAHAEMLPRGPLRASAIGSQGHNIPLGHDMGGEHERGMNPDEMMNGWGNSQRDEREPSEDFLNDDENENGDTGEQDQWREVGEFDLNTR